MTRWVELSMPDWLTRLLAAGVAVFMLLWGLLAAAQVFVGRVDLLASGGLLVAFAGAWLTLTVAWVRWAGRQASSGSAWSAIPRSQYLGRFAEAGGLTRWEQEEALPDESEQ